MKCWEKLNDFGQFCEKIRGIHQNLVEVSCASSINKYGENTETLDDEMEEHIPMEESDPKMPLLSIESDLGDDIDPLDRRGEFTFFY